MTEKEYDKLAQSLAPKSPIWKDCLNAFLVGGLICRHPDRTDLNDLAPDLYGQHLLGRRGAGPRLVPFHIQYNVVHHSTSLFVPILYHNTKPCIVQIKSL